MKQKEIVNFSQEGMVKRNPTEDGTYMTIRSGLCGIYKMINVWENDKWQIEVLDASSTIARSERPLTTQEIDNFKSQVKEYEVGDRVKIKSLDWYNENKNEDGDVFCGEYDFVDLMTKFCGKVVTIENCYEHDCYTIKEDNEGFVFTGEMFEGLVKETSQKDEFMAEEADERVKNHKRLKVTGVCQKCAFAVKDDNPHCGLRGFRSDFNVKSCSAKNNIIPNGFELQSDGYFSWINRQEYPKTYEECSLINGAEGRISLSIIGKFTKLINARNAYWKIAGQEMGLKKPWKPDWTNQELPKYCIAGVEGQTKTAERYIVNTILAFPTAEMRDAFYENFKELIEECKDFL